MLYKHVPFILKIPRSRWSLPFLTPSLMLFHAHPIMQSFSYTNAVHYNENSRSARHLFSASSQPRPVSSHLSPTRPHVLDLMILSTLLSFLMIFASISVLASLGKSLPLYGSSRSSTTRSLSLADSISFRARSWSLGVKATLAQ